jgi:hypothetical protein
VTGFLDTTHRNVLWFTRAAESGELVLRPRYQRNPVWLHPQKSFLIDTVLRGYPVPEIYMQDVVSADATQKHFVVDGQQRLTACLEFVAGEFELSPKESPDWPEMTFEDLATDEKTKVLSYVFVVRLMPDIDEDELRSIFRRLNRYNLALNKQELRHATYWGEFIASMERIADHDFWADSGLFSANDVRRMLDVEFVSELAVGWISGPQNKKTTLDRWYGTYEEEFPDRRTVEEVFNDVLGELGQILPDIRRTRWARGSDFYSLFLCVADHTTELPLASEKRALAAQKLTVFGDEVTAALAKDAPHRPAALVKRYADAVSRAASDLARRQERIDVLELVLGDVFAAV